MSKPPPFCTFILVWVLIISVCVSGYSYKPIQYHIQTDKGSDRYFRFQTINGQFRREKRFDDGRVVGTYGWVDGNGLLRLYDYMADDGGYEVVREQTFQVDPIEDSPNSISDPTRKVYKPTKRPVSSVVRKPITNTVVSAKPTATKISSPPKSAQKPTKFIKDKPKLRPLYVKKKRKRPASRFPTRRKTYVSSRNRVTTPVTPKPIEPVKYETIVDGATIRRGKPIRKKTIIRPYSAAPNVIVHPPSTPSPPLHNFGYDRPGGKVTINFDIGNQYRKEKRFPDGTVIGEHGYVDPLGILRATAYKSDKNGLQEAKKSYWIGTRAPGMT